MMSTSSAGKHVFTGDPPESSKTAHYTMASPILESHVCCKRGWNTAVQWTLTSLQRLSIVYSVGLSQLTLSKPQERSSVCNRRIVASSQRLGVHGPEPDPPPTIFPHPETDRLWISGQANFISQWHPAFHSPYQGPNSLPPQAQDATSRVLTLFTGLRLSSTSELICDVQESGGHGIGEALGLAGVTNLDVVRNTTLSRAPYVARLIVHQIIPLSREKETSERTPFSLFGE